MTLARALSVSFLAILPLLAEESAKTSEPDMSLWKWLNFAILAAILGWLIVKNLGPMLVARSAQIHQGLAAGEKAKTEAEARAAAVQLRLAGLETTIGEMRKSASEELARESERIQRETSAELGRIQHHALQDLESAGKLARIELQRQAAKLAIDLAEQKVRTRMSPEKQTELIDNFTGGLHTA